MLVMAEGMETLVEGIRITESERVLDIKIQGFRDVVGLIDEREQVLYMPTSESMRARLTSAGIVGADRDCFLDKYEKIGTELLKRGYQQRLVVDD